MEKRSNDPAESRTMADEIETHLRSLDEQRAQAARLAKTEAEVAGLSARLRRTRFGFGVFAALTAVTIAVVGAFVISRHAPREHRSVEPPSAPARRGPDYRAPLSPLKMPQRTASTSLPVVPMPTAPYTPQDTPVDEPSAPVTSIPDENAPVETGEVGATRPALPETRGATAVVERRIRPGSIRQPDDIADQIKAALIINFVRYIEWPDSAFAGPDAPFTIGVIGSQPISDTLEEMIGRTIMKGRHLLVRRVQRGQKAAGCQLVFIGHSEAANPGGILSTIANPGVLTVGETPGFATAGGMIELQSIDGKIAFTVNRAVTARAGIEIGSQLLKHARFVRSN